MKTEYIIILFSILILTGLGIRADSEADIRATARRIAELEEQVITKEQQIRTLNDQLKPPPYSQPIEKIVISSGTGIRVNPLGGGTEALHKGADIAGELGDPVNAVLAGRVVEHWLPPGWHYGILYHGHYAMGGYIVINHGDDLFSLYGHLSKTSVHEGDWIEAGQQIGEMGSTGMSTGVHLHFEVVVNPFKYLQERRR